MKIIAVDDEEGALTLLKKAISQAEPDAEINAFGNVEDVLDYIRDNKTDVAFLDIRMPLLSGLELAKRIKKTNPLVNIIFTTGFSEYAMDAMKMRSSGYLLKPVTKTDVALELKNLRNPVDDVKKGVFFKTFGFFDCFVDGRRIAFRREKAKETLAYLVDRHGSSVTRKELSAVIFEDREYTRSTQTYLTQIISNLKKTLEEYGIADILSCDYNTYAINPDAITCDSYLYLKGNPDAMNSFTGEYMSQYSWGEESLYQFYE